MTLGEKITILRKRKQMTQQDLADKLNTTKQTIGKYENGIVTNLPLNRIYELAAALDCEPGYLTGWLENPQIEKGSTELSDASQDELLKKYISHKSKEEQFALARWILDNLDM